MKWFLTAGSTLGERERPLGRKETFMHVALGIAFGMIVVAPFFGRWRANVWLEKHISAEHTVTSIQQEVA
jgi:hypothetical protein